MLRLSKEILILVLPARIWMRAFMLYASKRKRRNPSLITIKKRQQKGTNQNVIERNMPLTAIQPLALLTKKALIIACMYRPLPQMYPTNVFYLLYFGIVSLYFQIVVFFIK